MAQLLSLPGVKGTYAVGLAWRHEDAIPKAKALRELAAERGQWGIVYTTSAGAVQAGFCDPIDGVQSPRGVKALAAVVADAHPQPWMGIFDLGNDLYWLLAVRDGNEVIPDGDLVGTLEQVHSARDRHLPLGDWNERAGALDDLASIANVTAKQPVLRDLKGQPWALWGGLAGGLAAILAVGAVWYWHTQQVEAERQARLAAARAREAALRQRQQVVVLPWTLLPAASSALAACEQAWKDQALGRTGWILSSWKCAVSSDGASIVVNWTRKGGTAAEAPGTATNRDSALTQHALPKPDMGQPALATTERPAEIAAWTMAQTYAVPLQLMEEPGPKPIPGSSDGNPPPPPSWVAKTAIFDMVAPPWRVVDAQGLDMVPGLRLTEVTFNAATMVWSTAGKLYALPLAPATGKP
ncbi:hypothetical protein AU476_06160 [Cupriavidus sp. UYMSc13B]|nr:hypothetical protein AU476_06160 [Cupriavidus sp. UYMSc13B]